jgi:glycosyltransferase involved in cell wall biosynthesis
MDIFFFPSAFEGLSLALLEAQANSLPCVISSMISSIGILNENVYTVPIDETPAKWASAILEAHAKGRTNDNRLFGSRFDLDSESLAVQNLLVS